jgi:hypothetical protein
MKPLDADGIELLLLALIGQATDNHHVQIDRLLELTPPRFWTDWRNDPRNARYGKRKFDKDLRSYYKFIAAQYLADRIAGEDRP